MKKDQALAAIELSAAIGRVRRTYAIHMIARAVAELQKIAGQLHSRYENACSYEWATTEKYERATEKLEARAAAIGKEYKIKVTHQRDPRGWPLIVTIKHNKEVYETRLA